MRTAIVIWLAGAAAAWAAGSGPSREWIERRVADWQPTPREKRWETIGWAPGLAAALTLARQHARPVFLFTLDGRMDVGRC